MVKAEKLETNNKLIIKRLNLDLRIMNNEEK